MDTKLTRAQIYMLNQAEMVARRRDTDGGWFIPAKHETADVYGTVATCKALCGRGLLEYRVVQQAVGRYRAILEYRITDAGEKYQREL